MSLTPGGLRSTGGRNALHESIDFQVKVVDEKGDIVPFGTPGELMIRGYLVMDGYFNDDDATAKAMQNGWFRTG